MPSTYSGLECKVTKQGELKACLLVYGMKLRGKQNPMPTHLPYSCLYKDHTHGITPCSLEELGQDQCTLVKEMPAEIHFITSESAGWFSALSFLVPQTQCASKSQSTSRGEQEWMHILNVEVFQTPGATYYLLITRLTVPEILRLPKKSMNHISPSSHSGYGKSIVPRTH